MHGRACLGGQGLPEGDVPPRLQADRPAARLIQRVPLENDVTIGVSNEQVKAKVEARPPPAVLKRSKKTGSDVNNKCHLSNKSHWGVGFSATEMCGGSWMLIWNITHLGRQPCTLWPLSCVVICLQAQYQLPSKCTEIHLAHLVCKRCCVCEQHFTTGPIHAQRAPGSTTASRLATSVGNKCMFPIFSQDLLPKDTHVYMEHMGVLAVAVPCFI